jgi:nucleotide-binding universal stress UspA family protein
LISVNAPCPTASHDEFGGCLQQGFETMALKDILVHVDSSRAMPGRVRAAAELARVHEAHLTGLFVIEIPVLPTYAEAQIPAKIIEAQRAAFAAAATTAKDEFDAIAESAGVSAEWRSVEDRRVDALALHAHYVDLLVVGQADKNDPECVSSGLADQLALACGRPVMVIPAVGASGPIGKNIVIGWNTRREAVRAVSDAMPLLESADRVSVVTINAKHDDPDNAGIPGADIGLHLARHGIDTQTESLFGAPAGIGELLLQAARDTSADLLVMGAYGHSRFREIILGGVTAHVLAHTHIPTLLSH